MTTLDDIADEIEASWYGAPQLRDWKNDPRNPKSQASDDDEGEQ